MSDLFAQLVEAVDVRPERTLVVGSANLAKAAALAGSETSFIADRSFVGPERSPQAAFNALEDLGIRLPMPGVWNFWGAVGMLSAKAMTAETGWSSPTWHLLAADTLDPLFHPCHWSMGCEARGEDFQDIWSIAQSLKKGEGILAFREIERPAGEAAPRWWREDWEAFLSTHFEAPQRVVLDRSPWLAARRNMTPATVSEDDWLQP